MAIGALIYLASRSVGGGWAGTLLSGLFAWLAFDLTLSFVRGVGRVQARIQPRHAVFGGCLAVIAACAAGGLALFFGQQLLIGVILGGVAAVFTHRTRLSTLGPVGGSMPLRFPGPAAALAALLCLLAGLVLGGLGSLRVLEGYSYATDIGCTHPCGMVHGMWVRVIPNTRGDFVTWLDPDAVQIRLRFRDDVAGDRIASRSAFVASLPPEIYPQVADRQGCEAWAPRLLHLGDSTGDLTLCVTIPQSQDVDVSQLVLDWAEGGVTAPILLGKEARPGLGIDVNTG